MDEERWSEVDRYLADALGLEDPALHGALDAAKDAGLPEIQVSAPYGKLLHLLARACGARRILEIGTLGGYSAIWLARALPAEALLVTLELDDKHAAVARENLARAGLADRAEVRVGPALETLPRLAAEGAGPFDLVFIDADKVGYPAYLEWALRLTRRGSLIVADNVVRGGAVADASSADENVRAVRRYIEMVAREPRLSATVIQTVGVKGYDGLALALVVSDQLEP